MFPVLFSSCCLFLCLFVAKPTWTVKAPKNLFDNADQAWAKFAGNNDKIDFKMFLAALRNANINITEDMARKMFANFANKDGFIDRKMLDALLQSLDKESLNPFAIDIGKFKLSDLNDPAMLKLFTKLVMLNAVKCMIECMCGNN